uniref:Transposase n=1 Tax=Romanomermis culicivorax TaxID=13658 RepID=A0A915KGY9_ROMCU
MSKKRWMSDLVDGSKRRWTFSSLATLTEEIWGNILVFIPEMRKILKRLSTVRSCNTKEKWPKLWRTAGQIAITLLNFIQNGDQRKSTF